MLRALAALAMHGAILVSRLVRMGKNQSGVSVTGSYIQLNNTTSKGQQQTYKSEDATQASSFALTHLLPQPLPLSFTESSCCFVIIILCSRSSHSSCWRWGYTRQSSCWFWGRNRSCPSCPSLRCRGMISCCRCCRLILRRWHICWTLCCCRNQMWLLVLLRPLTTRRWGVSWLLCPALPIMH